MPKTLLVAEKPSVGQDLARVLPGPFEKKEGWLEGPDHVVTWAVGHLVQLAEPEAYDAKYKSWRMGDLPIVPEHFKLVVRDERSRKQMSVVTKQIGRDDIGGVVNACDAGREGELIFAYLYEKAKGKKPVNRLWLKSMTSAAMKEAFQELRPADDFARLEQAARSREILIGQLTYALVRDFADVEEIAPLTLKGKSQPVPLWEVTALKAKASTEAA